MNVYAHKTNDSKLNYPDTCPWHRNLLEACTCSSSLYALQSNKQKGYHPTTHNIIAHH